MNDDQMDELLIQGARDYNAPRAGVPREEMWSRIQAERVTAARARRRASSTRSWQWAGGIAAAVLLVATGVVIGRRMTQDAPKTNTVAKAPEPVTPGRDSTVTALRGETRRTQETARQLATRQAVPGVERDSTAETENLAYHLVLLRHLSGTEAMITAFRASARRGEVDAQMAQWSRDLLSTTRMLEASPIAQDPTMKRLLEDLELVTVQITQYVSTGKHNTDDLDLIEQSIKKRGVMSKLRSSLPVRNYPAGT